MRDGVEVASRLQANNKPILVTRVCKKNARKRAPHSDIKTLSDENDPPYTPNAHLLVSITCHLHECRHRLRRRRQERAQPRRTFKLRGVTHRMWEKRCCKKPGCVQDVQCCVGETKEQYKVRTRTQYIRVKNGKHETENESPSYE